MEIFFKWEYDNLKKVPPLDPDLRTRGGIERFKRPISTHCIAACNMAKMWNLSPELRGTTSLSEARRMAEKLAKKLKNETYDDLFLPKNLLSDSLAKQLCESY
ncbi:Hypothetical protein FKW44_010261 [Caligus rogercresseyi]|uniref:Uncharacterized protein n=1 Tax=Caligus rogercresseyi TaxID=217165 RepID=A0A7T8HGM9_CALRO|nr:Hypothetical protein FKW44_010261 [Caligus rogercresseyi]